MERICISIMNSSINISITNNIMEAGWSTVVNQLYHIIYIYIYMLLSYVIIYYVTVKHHILYNGLRIIYIYEYTYIDVFYILYTCSGLHIMYCIIGVIHIGCLGYIIYRMYVVYVCIHIYIYIYR